MANVRTLSKSAEYGIIRQPHTANSATAYHCGGATTAGWTNVPTNATAYRRVQYNADSVVFDSAVTIDQYESSGQNGIHDETAQFFVDKLSGLPTMTFSMPADQKTLAPHLIGALGAVSEGASTPYVKTITCAGLTGAVDFGATGSGWPLHAVAMNDTGGSGSDGKWIENCIIQDLTLEFDFLASGVARLGQLSGTWIGNEINLEQTMTDAAFTATTLTPYNNTDLFSFTTLTVGGVDWSSLAFRKFSLTINNNVTKDKATTAGKASQYSIKPEYTSEILLDYDTTTQMIAKDYQQGSSVAAATFANASPSTDGGLSIACVTGELMSQPEYYEGEYKAVKLDIKWYANGAATPLTILVTDTQEWKYVDE